MDNNEAGIEFVLVDLDAALTFLDVADTSRIQETKDRNYKNAWTAYNAVLRVLQKLSPNAGQRRAIDEKIARLQTRLRAAGYQF